MLYTIERDYVFIIAVARGKREPGYWRYRLRSKQKMPRFRFLLPQRVLLQSGCSLIRFFAE